MDNFSFGVSPQTPHLGVRFAHIMIIGRGAVAPSQTLPRDEEQPQEQTAGTPPKNPKDGLQRGGETRAVVLNSPVEAHRKARKRRKRYSRLSPRFKTKTPPRAFLSGSMAFLTAGAGTRNPPTEPKDGRKDSIEIRCISFRRILEERGWQLPRWSTSG